MTSASFVPNAIAAVLALKPEARFVIPGLEDQTKVFIPEVRKSIIQNIANCNGIGQYTVENLRKLHQEGAFVDGNEAKPAICSLPARTLQLENIFRRSQALGYVASEMNRRGLSINGYDQKGYLSDSSRKIMDDLQKDMPGWIDALMKEGHLPENYDSLRPKSDFNWFVNTLDIMASKIFNEIMKAMPSGATNKHTQQSN